LDNQRIGTFTPMAGLPFVSKRFALKRFLGMTDEDLAENEKMWKEENGAKLSAEGDAAAEMRSAGITPGGLAGDMGAETAEAPMDMAAAAEAGGEAAPAEGGAATPPAA
jgi:hypothetical protein